MSDTKLQVILKEQGVEGNQAQSLLEAFGAPFEEAGAILADYQTIVVTDEKDSAGMLAAREKRLALKKTRTTVENKRKELKSDIVKTGRAIDSVARFVKEIIEPAEQYLQLQEDFAKIKEQERYEKLRADRLERLHEYTDTPGLYNYMDVDDAQFDELVAGLKRSKEAAAAAAKKAEEDRIAKQKAEAKAAEKQRLENERLKKEAAEREREIEKEREASEAKLAKERAKRLAAEKAERDRKAEEARKEAEAKEAERQALAAPDKEKLLNFAQALEMVRTAKLPAVSSEKAQILRNKVDKQLAEIFTIIQEGVEFI